MTRMLYVEDDEDDKDLTLIHFREAGFLPEVDWARNGEEALERLRRGLQGAPLPDLILADLKMPKMSGLELLAQVRANAHWSRIPFVFMTSSGDHRDKEAAESLRVSLYLEKPISGADYAAVVMRLSALLGEAKAARRLRPDP